VLVHGDLSKLNASEKLAFYKARCDAAGLDMRGRPFEFLSLQGKLVLYAKKECAEQLNGMHGLSHEIVSTEAVSGLYEVRVRVTSRAGRTSEDVGTVVTDGLRGADLANARMKAVTKAKRRATLSFCGLGDVIDETELDTMGPRRACSPTGSPLALDNGTGHGKGQYASPEQTETYCTAMESYVDRRNAEWLDRWVVHGETPDGLSELCNRWQADNHLVKWARETGRIQVDAGTAERGVQNRQIGRYTAIVYHRSKSDREAISRELRRYIDELAERQTEKLKAQNPSLFGEPVPIDECEVDDGFEGVTDADSDVWPEGRE
jgi:hypothetical protein